MLPSVEDIVKEHVEASRKMRQEWKQHPEKARQFLIKAGILDKSGKRLAKRYRSR